MDQQPAVCFRDDMPPGIRGDLDVRIFRRGVLYEHWRERNVICNGSRQQLARLVGGSAAGRTIVNIGFGTGSGTADPANTSLTSPFIKALNGVSFPVAGQATFAFSLLPSEANGMNIWEFGLLCGDGTLFARRVRAGALAKAADFALLGNWTLTF